MLAALLRLMTILSLMAMPLGMASAEASSDMVGHNAATAEHCAETGNTDAPPAGSMDCTAACSALPAAHAQPFGADVLRPAVPRNLSATRSFDDAIPEIATPPPRLERG